METVHKDHLLALLDVDLDTFTEFCKVAVMFFQNGSQPKMIEKAARKLDWPPEKLQATLEAIMEIFKESIRTDILPEDLKICLISIGLQEAYAELLVATFVDNRQRIRELIKDASFNTVRLKSFEWRFEVEIASRTIHNEAKPHFLLRMDLDSQGKSDVHTVQMDIPTLLHVTEELEQALLELKSAHSKKMMRHAK